MADLPELDEWTTGVYQIETSDPVLGGPEGISNQQAKQLASRTRWLKGKIDALISGTVSAAKAVRLATARTISINGAGTGSASFDGSANAAIALTLADSGAVAGTYTKVTVNAKGLVTVGAAQVAADIPALDWSKIATGKPTTLTGYGITDAAPSASPTLTGDPKAPTPAAGDNDTSIATTAFVQTAIATLVASSPAALDTLNELAAALGNDPNFATTMTNSLALKAPLASPTFTGDPKAPTPAAGDSDTSIATTAYVQGAINGAVNVSIAGTGNVNLTAAQAGASTINLTGVLTGNKTLTVPSAAGRYLFINSTTGKFTVTVKTAAGTGQLITQGQSSLMFCDATNVLLQQSDFISPTFLGLPLAPSPDQFSQTGQVATAAFVQQALGSRSGYVDYQAASGKITVADAGKYIGLNRGSAQAYALPDANTLPQGTSFYLEAVGGDVTLTAPNTKFAGPAVQAAASSFVLKRDTACEFIVISSTTTGETGLSYRVLGGVGKALVARNGYERMPNGLIRMWGDGYAGGHANQCAFGAAIVRYVYNTFPIAFPNELFGVVVTHNAAGSTAVTITTNGEGLVGFNAAASYAIDCTIRWQAIGR